MNRIGIIDRVFFDKAVHGEWRCEAEPMYSYEVYEAEHVISLEPWDGYIRSNRIRRKVLTRRR